MKGTDQKQVVHCRLFGSQKVIQLCYFNVFQVKGVTEIGVNISILKLLVPVEKTTKPCLLLNLKEDPSACASGITCTVTALAR